MSYTVKKLLAIFEAEVGYLEKETNSKLDDKTANAGDENYTKYARDLYKAGYYNGNKQGTPWCDMTVDWAFYQLCDKDAKKAQQMTYQTGTLGAGCKYSAGYYRKAGKFFSTPEVGDQIFFGVVGSEKHTGIVYKVDSEKVYTIEGNTREESGVIPNGGGVFKKEYSLNDPEIAGYGRPAYDEELVKKEECSVNLPILKKGCKGESVKALQTLLIGYKYSCGAYGADGDFGSATYSAVRRFQKAHGLSTDGIVGSKTWAKLLGV